jgi:hypothetical protein
MTSWQQIPKRQAQMDELLELKKISGVNRAQILNEAVRSELEYLKEASQRISQI